ncbi:MAG: hypothetical protein QG610_1330 [Euryarchaeota archaeon]|nr:hypothetical protein [Euryarchaeota archaeon]
MKLKSKANLLENKTIFYKLVLSPQEFKICINKVFFYPRFNNKRSILSLY